MLAESFADISVTQFEKQHFRAALLTKLHDQQVLELNDWQYAAMYHHVYTQQLLCVGARKKEQPPKSAVYHTKKYLTYLAKKRSLSVADLEAFAEEVCSVFHKEVRGVLTDQEARALFVHRHFIITEESPSNTERAERYADELMAVRGEFKAAKNEGRQVDRHYLINHHAAAFRLCDPVTTKRPFVLPSTKSLYKKEVVKVWVSYAISILTIVWIIFTLKGSLRALVIDTNAGAVPASKISSTQNDDTEKLLTSEDTESVTEGTIYTVRGTSLAPTPSFDDLLM
jgi:hypothetical protein